MKKILAMMLTAAMMLSMSAAVMAEESNYDDYKDKLNVNASFTKTYDIVNEDNNSKSPAETFTFTFTKVSVEEQEAGITIDDMPDLEDVTAPFDALTADGTYAVEVPIDAADFPGIGVYTYKVSEVKGNTAGVTYNDKDLYLVVTILRDTLDNEIKYVAALHYSTEDGAKTGDVTNKYEASSLEVKKNVTGNMGDKTKEFTVTVTFTAPKNEKGEFLAVNEVINYTDGEAKTIPAKWENGTATATLTLKHDETVTFTNIPYGVTYTVVESDYTTEANGGYDAAVYTGSDVVDGVVTGNVDSTNENVLITNNKGTEVDTGISVDSIPYIAMLGVVAVGGAGVVVSKKRRSED